ncbi:MAG: hypothetical protein AAF969_08120, partial [Bacteroidota bacterium]
ISDETSSALAGPTTTSGISTSTLVTAREVMYNLEHTIHHHALIKVGIQFFTDIPLPESFGVAPSTLQHRQACAQ